MWSRLAKGSDKKESWGNVNDDNPANLPDVTVAPRYGTQEEAASRSSPKQSDNHDNIEDLFYREYWGFIER